METHRSDNGLYPKEGSNLHLQHEIRTAMTTLSKNLADLNRLRFAHRQSPAGHEDDDDNRGIKSVTLAGTNKGSVVQADMDELTRDDHYGRVSDSDANVFAFANSNYQAVNNSVMLGGSYRAEDPGVHLDMSDYLEFHAGENVEMEEEEEVRKKMVEDVNKMEEDDIGFFDGKPSKTDGDEGKKYERE